MEGSEPIQPSWPSPAASSTTAVAIYQESLKVEDQLSLASSETAHVSSDTGLDIATSFVYEKGFEHHPGLLVKNRSDSSGAQASNIHSYEGQRAALNHQKAQRQNAVKAHTDHFSNVVATYKSVTKSGELLPEGFDLRKTHNWDEVFRCANDAEVRCKAEGARNPFKRTGRAIQKAAPAMPQFLELIPNGNYTSALCGGLKIAFNIAHRMREKRLYVFEAFRKIPEIVRKAESCLEDYPSDPVLLDAATELYLAILSAVEGMIGYLVETSIWKKMGTAISQPLGNKPTDTNLKQMESQMELLLNRATMLQSKAIVRTDQNVVEIDQNVVEIDRNVRALRNTTDINQAELKGIRASASNTEKIAANIYPTVNLLSEDMADIRARMSEAPAGMVVLLQDQLRKAEWRWKREARLRDKAEKGVKKQNAKYLALQDELQAIRLTQAPVLQPTVSQITMHSMMTPQHLNTSPVKLEAVSPADVSAVSQDIQNVIRQGKRLKTNSQSRGNWLLHNKAFQAWLTSDASSILVVNGNAEGREHVSPMSLVSAFLLQSLNSTDTASTISFFCGLHLAGHDDMSGPQGLARSLISQLLAFIYESDLAILEKDFHRQLETHASDVAMLMELFISLVNRLPQEVVLFCVIDGISLFEKQQYDQETRIVFQKLSQITQAGSHGGLFKLLLTSPSSSKCAKEFFPKECSIIIPKNAGDGQLLTLRQVSKQASQVFRPQVGLMDQIVQSEQLVEQPAVEDADLDDTEFNDGNISSSDDDCE